MPHRLLEEIRERIAASQGLKEAYLRKISEINSEIQRDYNLIQQICTDAKAQHIPLSSTPSE